MRVKVILNPYANRWGAQERQTAGSVSVNGSIKSYTSKPASVMINRGLTGILQQLP